jgi:hypothetical protein
MAYHKRHVIINHLLFQIVLGNPEVAVREKPIFGDFTSPFKTTNPQMFMRFMGFGE